MHRLVRAFAVCLLQSGIWHAVLYSLQEDKYYVEMQCTNSYGHNMETCWPLYITTFDYQNMKKRLIKIKEYCLYVAFSKEACIVYLVNLYL